uniref:Uncharacterized protein n=1 Tax=Meloidogyne enterolobii TaxID=390850 RepID=A0A6V7W4S6_MELEN|nr:unnamed protein product [Meloidogyne enterolobii]
MFNFTKNYLNANVRLLLYYGDVDGVCNFLIGQKFSSQLGFNVRGNFIYLKINLKLKTPKQAWIVDKQIAGFKTEYDRGVTFTTSKGKLFLDLKKFFFNFSVRGGGHYVPQTNPKEALYMFKQFLDNKPL